MQTDLIEERYLGTASRQTALLLLASTIPLQLKPFVNLIKEHGGSKTISVSETQPTSH